MFEEPVFAGGAAFLNAVADFDETLQLGSGTKVEFLALQVKHLMLLVLSLLNG
jgi:hypothetical protein